MTPTELLAQAEEAATEHTPPAVPPKDYRTKVQGALGYVFPIAAHNQALFERKLVRVLNSAGVKVLPTKKVHAYQENTVRQLRRRQRLLRAGLPAFFLVGGVGLLVGLPVQFAVPAALLSIACGGALLFESEGKWKQWNWRNTPLAAYRGKVPVEATDLALKLREVSPDVTFEVAHLEETFLPRFQLDPFLKVRLGSQFRYIYVWDEVNY